MTNGNDAAFATPTVYGPDEDRPSMIARYEDGADGLTKREYFAATAMQGLCSNEYESWQQQAETAVRAADALIEALNQSNEAFQTEGQRLHDAEGK